MGKRKGKRYKIEEKSLIVLKGKKVFSIVKRIILLSIIIITILIAITCFIKKDEIIEFFESKTENQIEVIDQNQTENQIVVIDQNQSENKIEQEEESKTETQNNTKTETENQTKTETQTKKEDSVKKPKLFQDKKYQNMKITNIEMKKDSNGYSHLKCVIENNTGKKYKGENVYIIFTGKNKVELAKFGYKLKAIKSGKSLNVHLITSTDITNSEDFYIKKIK